MSRDNQIEEMGTIIATKAFERAHEIDGDENLADIVATELYEKGYRKASDVAEKIFADIEFEIHQLDFDWGETKAIAIEGIIAELKKKYTVTDTNVGCKDTEGEK